MAAGMMTASGEETRMSYLTSTLCVYKCTEGCVIFRTPLLTCFNGKALFPEYDDWSDYDLMDIRLNQTHFERRIFRSQNQTCLERETDIFRLPVDECVGPFGYPRPWGFFNFETIQKF